MIQERYFTVIIVDDHFNVTVEKCYYNHGEHSLPEVFTPLMVETMMLNPLFKELRLRFERCYYSIFAEDLPKDPAWLEALKRESPSFLPPLLTARERDEIEALTGQQSDIKVAEELL